MDFLAGVRVEFDLLLLCPGIDRRVVEPPAVPRRGRVDRVVEGVVGIEAGGEPARGRRLLELGGHPRRVELGVVDALGVHLHSNREQLGEDDLGALVVVGAVVVPDRVELEVRSACCGEQLLRLVDVVAAEPPSEHAGLDRRLLVPDPRPGLEGERLREILVDQLLHEVRIEGEREGLADAVVGELGIGEIHPERDAAEGDRTEVDLDIRVCLKQVLEVRQRVPCGVGEVDLADAERGKSRRRVAHDEELGTVQQDLALPVVRVLDEAHV